jgi:hypothetical protein
MKLLFVFLLIIAFVVSTTGCATQAPSLKKEPTKSEQKAPDDYLKVKKPTPWWLEMVDTALKPVLAFVSFLAFVFRPLVTDDVDEDHPPGF